MEIFVNVTIRILALISMCLCGYAIAMDKADDQVHKFMMLSLKSHHNLAAVLQELARKDITFTMKYDDKGELVEGITDLRIRGELYEDNINNRGRRAQQSDSEQFDEFSNV